MYNMLRRERKQTPHVLWYMDNNSMSILSWKAVKRNKKLEIKQYNIIEKSVKSQVLGTEYLRM